MKRIEYISVKNRKKKYRIPFYTVKGKKSGKTLMLIAGQHGGEWVGIEVIRRFFVESDPAAISGTVLAVPVANPMAVELGQQHFLFDRKEKSIDKNPRRLANKHCYNMNRLWPGRKDGSVLQQAVAEIWERGVSRCDVLVDFHCYSRNNAHAVYISPTTQELGRALNLGFLADMSGRKDLQSTLSEVARRHGKLALAVEFVGHMEIIEEEVRDGLSALYNLMQYLGMLSGHPESVKKQYLFNPGKTENILIKSSHTGFVLHRKQLMEKVRKGEIICDIFDLQEGRITHRIKSPITGVITHRRYLNLVRKGELVAAVARLPEV